MLKYRLTKTRSAGLMLAMSALLTSCAGSPEVKTVPDYPPDFLMAVADQYDARVYGDETAKAIDDWCVMINC